MLSSANLILKQPEVKVTLKLASKHAKECKIDMELIFNNSFALSSGNVYIFTCCGKMEILSEQCKTCKCVYKLVKN